MRTSCRGIFALIAVILVAAASAAPVPKKQGEEVFLVQESSVPKTLGADGKVLEEKRKGSVNTVFSPDGKMWVSTEYEQTSPGMYKEGEGVIRNRGGEELHRFAVMWGKTGPAALFRWSADGRKVFMREMIPRKPTVHRVYDLKSKEFSDVSVDSGFIVTDWSPDGKRLLAYSEESYRLAWLPLDGKGEPEFITPKDEPSYGGRLSPDGTKVLYRSKVETKYKYAEFQLFVFDLKAKKRARVTTADDGVPDSCGWSPDGRRVAYTWRQAFENPDDVTECDTKLITSNPDGSDPKTIVTRPYKGKGAAGVTHFELCDWR